MNWLMLFIAFISGGLIWSAFQQRAERIYDYRPNLFNGLFGVLTVIIWEFFK